MERLRIACIQWRMAVEQFQDPERVYQEADRLVAAAAASGDPEAPLLVAFPEDIGAPLLFTGAPPAVWQSPGLAGAMKGLIRAHLARVLLHRLFGRSWTEALGQVLGAEGERRYVDIFSRLARRHRATIVAGSILLPDPGGRGVVNVSYTFGPDGAILGRQGKVHLIEIEGDGGIGLTGVALNSLAAIDLPFARIGVAICHDAFFPDVLERLEEQGAEILVQPSANPGPWTTEQQLDWLRSSAAAVREPRRFLAAANPMLVGRLFDLEFEGQSAIFLRGGPASAGYVDLGPQEACVAAARVNLEDVIVVELDRGRLVGRFAPLDHGKDACGVKVE